MGILDKTLQTMTQQDIVQLIQQQIALNVPAIPAGLLALSNYDLPIIAPQGATVGDNQALVWDPSVAAWVASDSVNIALTVPDGSIGDSKLTDMSASKLTAGVIDAAVIAMQTAGTGVRVVLDTTGITLFGPDGVTQVVSLPTDATKSPTFAGTVTTGGLTVQGGMVIQGATNIMDKGSVLTLNEHLGDPGEPTVVFEYATEVLSIVGTSTLPQRGLDYDASGGAGGSTAVYLTSVVSSAALLHEPPTYGITLLEFSAATGVISRSATIIAPGGTGDFSSAPQINGVARLGSRIWVCYTDPSNTTWIQSVTQSTFALDTLTKLSTVGAPTGLVSAQMGFGTDGTHLLLAAWTSSSSSSAVTVNQISVSGGAPSALTSFALTGGSTRTTSLNVLSGITGRDGSDYVTTVYRKNVTPNSTTYIERFSQSTKARVDYWCPDAVQVGGNSGHPYFGVTWDGSAYHSLDGTQGLIYNYSGWTWTAGSQSDTYQVGYSWYNSGGPYESALSPQFAIQLNGSSSSIGLATSSEIAMRGQLRVISPSLPSGVTADRVYMKLSSTAVAAGSQSMQTIASTATSGGNYTNYITAYASAGGAALTSTTFPGGTSDIQGVASAATAPWKMGGDGTNLLPRFTVAQRIGSPTKGQLQLNEDRTSVEFYDGAAWETVGPEYVTKTISIGSTTAGTGGTQSVTITGLNVGDICIWAGVDVNSPFTFSTQPPCALANTIVLNYFNGALTGSNALASHVHTFLILRRT